MRWNPEQEDIIFLTQAATVNTLYNFCQMAVHRNFLSSSPIPSRESALSLPSAIICTNAARSSIQVLEVLYNRTGSPDHRNTVCTAALEGTAPKFADVYSAGRSCCSWLEWSW